MPRTPLLRAFARLARDHRLAHELGTEPEAIRIARQAAVSSGAATLTRRQLLQSIAVAGAGVALGATLPPRPVSAAQAPRIVIAGGGIAGLTAALTLWDAGVPSTIYEASGRLGGRMFSATRYWADGQVSEWCGELIDTNHTTMQALCLRFALPLDDLLAAQSPGATETNFIGGFYYRELDGDFERIYEVLQRDLEAAGEPTSYQTSTPAGVALDDMSVRDWIRTRVPGGYGSRLGRLLDVAYAQEFGADPAALSALCIVYGLGSESKPGDVNLFELSDERFHIRGGNQLLPLAIAQTLPEGSIVRGRRMVAIEQSPAGTVNLTFRGVSGDEMVTADIAILALPFAVLRTLDYSRAGFDALKDRTIQEFGRGCNAKLMVQFASRYWRLPGPWGLSTGTTFADTGYQSSWEVSRAQRGTSGILVGYAGGSGAVEMAQVQPAPHTTAWDPRTGALA